MTRIFQLLAVSLLVLTASARAANTAPPAPAPASIVPAPPSFDVHSYYLMDYNTGKVLAKYNANHHWEPASLTKIMTVYVIATELHQGKIKLSDMVPISKDAWQTGGSRMFVEVGSKVSVENLLKGVIIQSGNDAAVALAEYVAGTTDAFASLMNMQAQRLGMKNTHFANVDGLPHPDHYTTAHDLAILTRALIHNYPDIYKIFDDHEFTWNKITQHNRNKLLYRDPSVDGVKTGYTQAAGYCLVASAKRDGMRLISVVMGAPHESGRSRDSQALLNWGFRFFETRKLYGAREPVSTVHVWKGAKETAQLGLTKALYVTVPRGQSKKLKASMKLDPRIIAPVAAGQQHGTLTVTLDGKQIAKRPLIALNAVPEGGIYRRMVDDVRLWFE